MTGVVSIKNNKEWKKIKTIKRISSQWLLKEYYDSLQMDFSVILIQFLNVKNDLKFELENIIMFL